jgi:hypothetical protein
MQNCNHAIMNQDAWEVLVLGSISVGATHTAGLNTRSRIIPFLYMQQTCSPMCGVASGTRRSSALNSCSSNGYKKT